MNSMNYVYLFASFINRLMFADTSGQVSTDCTNPADPKTCNNYSTGLPKVNADNAALQTILQIVFGALAVVAVLIVLIAAVRLVFTAGDADAAAKLRRTLIYAAVGLMIILLADAIVGFVLGKFIA